MYVLNLGSFRSLMLTCNNTVGVSSWRFVTYQIDNVVKTVKSRIFCQHVEFEDLYVDRRYN